MGYIADDETNENSSSESEIEIHGELSSGGGRKRRDILDPRLLVSERNRDEQEVRDAVMDDEGNVEEDEKHEEDVGGDEGGSAVDYEDDEGCKRKYRCENSASEGRTESDFVDRVGCVV